MFIIKEIKEGNPLIEGEVSYWGVFSKCSYQGVHCKSEYANLMCICYNKSNAEKIAEILNEDELLGE